LSLAGLIVAGLVAGGVALLRPLWLLPLLAAAIPFGELYPVTVGEFKVTALEPLVALLGLAWLADGVRRRCLLIRPTAILVSLLILIWAFGFSLFDSLSLSVSLKELVKWAEVLVVYLVITSGRWQRQEWVAIMALILAAGALEAAWGLWGAVQRVGPPSFLILGGRLSRAFGHFNQPNPFGGYVNLLWPVAVSLFLDQILTARFTRRARLPLAVLYGGVAAVAGAALVLSWSRGAWIGAAGAAAVLAVGWGGLLYRAGAALPGGATLTASRQTLARWGRRWTAGLLIGTALMLVVGLLGASDLLPAAVSTQIESIVTAVSFVDPRGVKVTNENFSVLERTAHWLAGLRMFEAHPWTGVGLGNYATAYDDYRLPAWEDPLGHAHNVYINLAAETGLPGLLAYLLFLGVAMTSLARAAWCRPDDQGYSVARRALAMGAFAALTAMILHNIFDSLWVHGIGVQVALLLGMSDRSSDR